MRRVVLLFFCMASYPSLFATSLVYNLRIGQVTKQFTTENTNKRNRAVSFVGLLFDQYFKQHLLAQNYVGGFFSGIYDFEPYYVRTDFAVSQVNQTADHVRSSFGTETDDLLFTLGRNFFPNDKAVVTLSGLFGVPTHKNTTLQHMGFGVAQVGMGLQLDGSYIIKDPHTLLYGSRYLYFVPRNAADIYGNLYRYSIGNVVDLLLAYKYNWPTHGLEGGYTFRADCGASIAPYVDEAVKATNYTLNSLYFIYKYRFKTGRISHRFLANISSSLGNTAQDNHSFFMVMTVWVSWGIRF